MDLSRTEAGLNSFTITTLDSKSCMVMSNGTHEWKIANFRLRPEQSGESLDCQFAVSFKGPTGAFVLTHWIASLYPKGVDSAQTGYVSLKVQMLSDLGPARTRLSVYIKGHDKVFQCAINYLSWCHSGCPKTAINKRLVSYKLMESLLENGDLNISFNIEILDDWDEDLLENRTEVFEVDRSFQFADLFKDRRFSDVTLCIENDGHQTVKFDCHKIVLAKRSIVFEAMFYRDGKATNVDEVQIRDSVPKAVFELLRYMYTGKVEDLNRIAKILFLASALYKVDKLKVVCEKALCSTISLDNVCSLLALANNNNSPVMKRKCIDFIAQNARAVVASQGWKDIAGMPDLVTDVVKALV